MPFGTENKESSNLANLLRFGIGHFLVCGKLLCKKGPRLGDGFILCFGITGSFGNHSIVITSLLQVVFGKVLGIAAQHDIGAAACHVRSNRDSAEFARLRNDLRFLLVILCIQHCVRNAAFFQQG